MGTAGQNGTNGTNGTPGMTGAPGMTGMNGAPGVGALVRQTAEAAGANCPVGGTRVDSGRDSNGNGMLDMSEITATQYVCSGSAGAAGQAGMNGRSALVTTAAEAAGTNCPFGGTRVQAGVDANGNSMLDASEVTSTGFVCAGAPGDAGVAGRNSLIANVSEPAGANCLNGGRRITTGVDTNGNGTLDTTEVTATSFVCNGPGLSWVNVTTATAQTASNTGYIANHTNAVTFTLPVNPVIGDIVRFKNGSSPSFVVAQNAGQSINLTGLDAFTPVAGTNWSQILNTGVNQYETRLASSSDGNTLLVMNSFSPTVQVSTDSGRTFRTATITDPDLGRSSISPNGSTMYIYSFTGTQGVFVSTDTGLTWTQRTSLQNIVALAAYAGGAVAIGTPPSVTTAGLYRTTDNGQTWTAVAIPAAPVGACWSTVAASATGAVLAVGGSGIGSCPGIPVFVSGNGGATWNASPNGAGPFQNRDQFVGVARNGSLVVVSSPNGDVPVFMSTDLGLTWTNSGGSFMPQTPSQPFVADDGQRIAVASNTGPVMGIAVSLDRGATWTTSPLVGTSRVASSLAGPADGSTLFYGEGRFMTGGSLVFRSPVIRTAQSTTTTGTTGSVTGGANAALELQFVGSGRWGALSGLGEFLVR